MLDRCVRGGPPVIRYRGDALWEDVGEIVVAVVARSGVRRDGAAVTDWVADCRGCAGIGVVQPGLGACGAGGN